MIERFGPGLEIGGPGDTRLIVGAGGVGHVVHPVLAIHTFRKNRAGFRPVDVPPARVGGHDHAAAIEAAEIARCGQRQLRVLAVICGVGEIPEAVDRRQPRVFDATALLVGRLGDEDRRLFSRELDAIATLSPTECRDALPILRAKQHDERRVVPDDGRVEGAACLESRATREEYWVAAVQTGPGRERRLVAVWGSRLPLWRPRTRIDTERQPDPDGTNGHGSTPE